MTMDYNAYFLALEKDVITKKKELREFLEEEVANQLSTQMEAVCVEMRSELIEAWNKGEEGRDITGDIFLKIPKDDVSNTYSEVFNEVTCKLLAEYGLDAVVDFEKAKAVVKFNFSRAFFENHYDWSGELARKYLYTKVKEMENTLCSVLYFNRHMCLPNCEKPFGNEVKIITDFPPILRDRVASCICTELTGLLNGYSLRDGNKIVFGLL